MVHWKGEGMVLFQQAWTHELDACWLFSAWMNKEIRSPCRQRLDGIIRAGPDSRRMMGITAWFNGETVSSLLWHDHQSRMCNTFCVSSFLWVRALFGGRRDHHWMECSLRTRGSRSNFSVHSFAYWKHEGTAWRKNNALILTSTWKTKMSSCRMSLRPRMELDFQLL